MAKAQIQEKKGIAGAADFFTASWEELKKVHPPTRQETIQVSVLVLALVIFFGVFLGLTDLVVGRIMGNILT
jgi:preprotein translocase SecE subunit